MLVLPFPFKSERAFAVTVVLRTQIACDMIRGSIYRCYGIIPTIKEVFHRPSDLRLASQDTENDLMAMSFTAHRACFNMPVCVCVCVSRSLHLQTPASFEGVQHVGLCLILVKVGESGRASKHVYQAISRLAGCSLGGPRGQYCTGDWTHRKG